MKYEAKFPLFFSFSASFKNSNPRKMVGKFSSFWDWWAESLFVSIIVAKYNIFPQWPLARKTKHFWRSNLLTLSAGTIGILSTLTYTECDRTSARYVIKKSNIFQIAAIIRIINLPPPGTKKNKQSIKTTYFTWKEHVKWCQFETISKKPC